MSTKALQFSEAFMKNPGGNASGGFNSRIMGYDYAQTMDGVKWDIGARVAGWKLADDMARAGKLYAVHNFHHSHECRGHAFPYGGTFVCNECGKSGLAKHWWTIKCYPDGNAWCCVGPDFENLQESDNFAFGDSYDAAIKAYGDLMVSRSVSKHTPECPYCGATTGLRQVHDGGGVTDPEYTCEGCFTACDDGPSFDDLPAKSGGAS